MVGIAIIEYLHKYVGILHINWLNLDEVLRSADLLDDWVSSNPRSSSLSSYLESRRLSCSMGWVLTNILSNTNNLGANELNHLNQ